MISVHLYRNNEKLLTQTFTDRKMVRLGRGDLCELSIPDAALSRHHCSLMDRDGVWFLEDHSRNGIFKQEAKGSLAIQDQDRLPQRLKLEPGIRYRLSRSSSFEISLEKKMTESDERTLITAERATQLLQFDAIAGRIMLGTPVLIGKTASGEVFERLVDQNSLTIGAHETNDLVLDDASISQFHARLESQPSHQLVLVDLGSTNGLRVNGLQVERAVLQEEATIEIGAVELRFELRSSQVHIQPKASHEFHGLVSRNRVMRKVFSLIETVAETDAPVFLHGETGSGKELLARAIHTLSPRHRGSFVAINCAALVKELVESELFGHEKGAFTGAANARAGAFEQADRGTLFLDEVAELDFNIQAKLLRVLESGELRRVGGSTSKIISVRIVCATHKDLGAEVAAKRFREDLFYRLHVVPVAIPALRERPEDLELLVPKLLKDLGRSDFDIDLDVMTTLSQYKFPGNIRELKNILQRALIEYQMLGGEAVDGKNRLASKHFHFLRGVHFETKLTQEDLDERDRLQALMVENQFNQTKVAKALNLPISTLHDRLKRLGLGRQFLKSLYDGTHGGPEKSAPTSQSSDAS